MEKRLNSHAERDGQCKSLLFRCSDGRMVYSNANSEVGLSIRNAVESVRCVQYKLEYNPDDFLSLFTAALNVMGGDLSRRDCDQVEIARLSLSIWPEQSRIATGCLGLWVDECYRKQGVGKVLLGQTKTMIQMTLSGLRQVFPCQVQECCLEAIEVLAESHPHQSMLPKLDRGIWYQTIKRILVPQGFEEKRDADEDGKPLPYLVQIFEL